ncbi:MAG: SpoIIE family protein phosphatase [Bacteroidales bacterium]|nr:SpoIIE family protein phosphatase [Bacteroidales bacterium]
MKYLKINIFTFLQIIIIFFFLFILNSNNCFAQTIQGGHPYIQNYNDEDYDTPGNQTWAVLQDNRGVMYFANNNGLLEFDGTSWRLIEISNKSVVRSLAIDRTGRVYVGAKSEFGYIEADTTGTKQYFSLLEKIPEEHQNFGDVWQTSVLNKQIIFRTAFTTFLLKDNKIKIIKPYNKFYTGFCVNNRFFVREWEKGLFTLINDSLIIIPQSEQFANERIYVMLSYEEDKILLVTRTQGIFIYTPSGNSPPLGGAGGGNFYKPAGFEEADNFLIKNQIYCGQKLNDEHFVLGTIQDGLIIIDKQGNIVRHFNKETGLQDNSIWSIYIDSQKNIWTGLNNGISYIITNSPFTLYNEKVGLQGAVYSATVSKNQLYAGTMLGIFRKNKQNNFVMLENSKGPCWHLAEINKVLYSGHFEGILKIDESSAENIAAIGNVWNFFELTRNPGYVLAGTADNGILLFAHNNYNLIFKHKIYGFDKSSRWMHEDIKGNIWIFDEFNGFYCLKLNETLDSVAELNFYNSEDGLPENIHNCVFKIKTANQNSRIVFGTEKGIYKFDQQSNRFVPDKAFSMLLEKKGFINQFVQDDKGNIYFQQGDEKGVLLLQTDNTYKLERTPFLKFKGLFIQNIYVIDTTTILFCSKDGIIHYNLQITPDYDISYPVLIRQVLVNDSLIFGGTKTTGGIIKLPYKQNALLFAYSALYYEDHDKTQYSYFLEGFDQTDRWSEWSLKTEKEYINLPEGNYSFKVKAKNVFKKESTIAVYSFIVLPPWYRTFWAYILYFILLCLIIWEIVKLNTKRLKAANIRLEQIVKERTIEISKQNKEILYQNAAIIQQKEEIKTQAEHLEHVNKELEKLSIVASETDNAVIIMDANGNIEWINEGFTRIYGYNYEQLVKKKGGNIIEGSANPNVINAVNTCLKNRKTIVYEILTTSKFGENIWAQTTLTPIIDDKGNITKLISIDSNITKLKNAEKEIIDSINYAKRIQNALFPSKEILKKTIPQYFILDLPQGIVSGDFYWFSEIKNKIIIAVVDCTGHGVPGAFMSMLGVTMLNKIVNEKGIIKPNEILDRLRKNVIISLHQTGKMGEANDGMDIALITIDKKNNSLEYSGANNSAYLFRNNEFTEIFADKMPIGIYSEIEIPFSCQKMSIQKDDIIYLFTDGYADQFGGSNGRKFLYKNFKNLLKEIHQLPLNEQKTKLFKTHRKWKENNEQVDDILVMGIKI